MKGVKQMRVVAKNNNTRIAYKETNDGFTIQEILGEERYMMFMSNLYGMGLKIVK